MKFNRLLALLLLLTLLPCAAKGEEEDLYEEETASYEAPGDILVIYPEEADRKHSDDTLAAIGQVLLSLRYTADFVEAGEAGAVIQDYEQVIWCATVLSDRLDASILQGFSGRLLILGRSDGLEDIGLSPIEGLDTSLMGLAAYSFLDQSPFASSVSLLYPGEFQEPEYVNGALQVLGVDLPLVSGRGKIHYLPLTDYTTNFARAVLIQEVAQWLWPYESRMNTYTEYVVLDAVYPFYDPYRLREIVDYMVALRMHFVISVMPVYEHGDYPAMNQFCEVLRYAQANGGSVILHAPIVQNALDAETLAARITTATRVYFDQDVYLLALEVPSEWLFRDDLRGILGRYTTLFISELDAFQGHAVREYGMKNYISLGSRQVSPALRLDETGISHLTCCSTAVYVDIADTEDDQIYAIIDAAKDAPIPMQSLWDMEQGVFASDGSYLSWQEDTLIVNGKQCFNVYTPREEESNFDYQRNMYYRFVANLANQNYFLIGISAIVLVVFIILGLVSRKQMHRYFLRRQAEERTGGDDHVSG